MARPSTGLRWLLLLVAAGSIGTAAQFARGRRAFTQEQFVCSPEQLSGPLVNVHLTVSPLTKPRSRDIELNWKYNANFVEWGNDTVALTRGDPAQAESTRLVSVAVGSHPNLRYRTQHRFPREELPADNMQDRCTDFWIGYFRGRQLLAKNCLKILPGWMWRNRQKLASMSVEDLMLPGTHNSGTYKRSRDIVFKLVATQDEDVWSQLMYGNRFLDLRVGYRSSDSSPFWIYHDFFPVRPIDRIVDHVKWFLNSTREVVVLDLHRFPAGFDSKVHRRFVDYLQAELGRWMAPRVYDVTMGELWASDRRLLVSYADRGSRLRNQYLWPPVPQAWDDKRSVLELHRYLKRQVAVRRGGPLWAAMAELTPSPWDILIPNRGLRDLAQEVNWHVTKWFRDEWWSSASIVATDFFLGNDMIDVAIGANLKRKQCVAKLARRGDRRARRGGRLEKYGGRRTWRDRRRGRRQFGVAPALAGRRWVV